MPNIHDSTGTPIIRGSWIYITGILSESDGDLAFLHEIVSSDTIKNVKYVHLFLITHLTHQLTETAKTEKIALFFFLIFWTPGNANLRRLHTIFFNHLFVSGEVYGNTH